VVGKGSAAFPANLRVVELTQDHKHIAATALRGKLTMALVIPWLLEREYQQHRNLDYYGLPEVFEEWREAANVLNEQLARVTRRRVMKVVIHPGELEEWARRKGLTVSAKVRSDFAGSLWRTERAYTVERDLRVRSGTE
jgi:hypothetical protein